MARRRQDKFPDLFEAIAKLVIIGVVLLALAIGGVTHFTEAFTGLAIRNTRAELDPEFQQSLNDRTKYCPKCEAPMVLRCGYNEFWGCSRFPQCRYTLKV